MICSICRTNSRRIAKCDCFENLCETCLRDHNCGREMFAVQLGHDDVVGEQNEPNHFEEEPPKAVSNSVTGLCKLRPYQQQALTAVLEVLL